VAVNRGILASYAALESADVIFIDQNGEELGRRVLIGAIYAKSG
jgi:hypothetical protein